ncbi:patatin-like phospholipase family protein, partial [Leptospira borgpetersenii serovar Balcanica]|uniref:patatin-like phospholipase family protein n=1 Tax=Leptospira borgpetersenii TaxID=174 RepID=UPI00188B24C9
MKRAIILSGGGARGADQAGVLRYLEEIQFKPDIICGTSGGAIAETAMGCG